MDTPEESVLEAIFEHGEAPDGDGALSEDADMLDAETLDDSSEHQPSGPSSGAAQPTTGGVGVVGGGQGKRKKRKNRKRRKGASDLGVADINRFVIDTCRHLREKKPYLVWNAVGCLGVSVVRDLVKEVDTIQSCGGQKTADGIRFRTGGGILWNILKTREPKAYKEIMAKGKEFEKQFRQHKTRQVRNGNEAVVSPRSACETVGPAEPEFKDVCPTTKGVAPAPVRSSSNGERESVWNRIRVPVAYGDLFEEGEIQ